MNFTFSGFDLQRQKHSEYNPNDSVVKTTFLNAFLNAILSVFKEKQKRKSISLLNKLILEMSS